VRIVSSALALSLLFAVAPARAAASGVSDPCRDVLDARVASAGTAACRSPDERNVNAVIPADEKPAPEKPQRDPALFPSELGFVAGLIGLAGGAVVAAAYIQDGQARTLEAVQLQHARMIGGVSLLALSGGVFGGAVATWVFDPSTGELKLPIFAGEP